MGAVSCGSSSCSCVSTGVSVGSILLTRFWFRCPYLIWDSSYFTCKCVERFDSEASQETSNIHCCAVVYLEVTPQSLVPLEVTAVLATFLLSSRLFLAARKDH